MNKISVILIFMLAFSVSAQQPLQQTQADDSNYLKESLKYENIYIGGQPKAEDFAAIKAAGFNTVINLRTPQEMEKLDFDEGDLLQKAEIDYHLIPIGQFESDYSDEKLEAFAQVMQASEGKVLLHCRSGHRASQLWMAYVLKYQGKTPEQAQDMLENMGK